MHMIRHAAGPIENTLRRGDDAREIGIQTRGGLLIDPWNALYRAKHEVYMHGGE